VEATGRRVGELDPPGSRDRTDGGVNLGDRQL